MKKIEEVTQPKARFRHELKYLINPGEQAAITTRIAGLLQRDAHAVNGEYKIRSLYFDDYWNSAYEEKMMGVGNRKKYRIRLYDDSDKIIHLERKTKVESFIYKESVPLTRDETEKILMGDYGFLLTRSENLCKEFYIECISHVMRPKVIVDYEREPFIFIPGDVRITFDKDIRAGILSTNLFDKNLPTLSCTEPGKLVMEVKFTEYLPNVIRQILPPKSSEFTAVSKYVLCVDKTSYLTESDCDW